MSAHDAVLAALPPLASRFRGAVASVMVQHEGAWLDGAVVIGAPHEVFLRPLPAPDPAALETWLAILSRRSGQVAHDLAGPATGVLAAVETILAYEPIADDTRALLSEARLGMLRLTQLLTEHRRGTSDPPTPVTGPLAQLVEEAARRAARVAAPSEQLELAVSATEASTELDDALLRRALEVLLSNAWKARVDRRARVRIEAELDAGLLRLAVHDAGRGLDLDTLRRAGELGFSTWTNGAGLGLFLLRRAASERGGAVLVERLDAGACVTLLVPEGVHPTKHRSVK